MPDPEIPGPPLDPDNPPPPPPPPKVKRNAQDNEKDRCADEPEESSAGSEATEANE